MNTTALMDFVSGIHWTSVVRGVGIAGLFAGAFYNATIQNWEEAFKLFSAATVATGVSSKLASGGQAQKVILTDLENIRNNPSMPGTPVSPLEARPNP